VNSYDEGLATNKNKNSWAIGIGMNLPLFQGFLTQNRVKEARARLEQLSQQKLLLREGLALQIKQIFLEMLTAQKQQAAAKAALDAATENRELTERAYKEELMETKDVIEAQLTESLMAAQYLKTQYDQVEAAAHLDTFVGERIEEALK
jgi:outer membrane protein TolC